MSSKLLSKSMFRPHGRLLGIRISHRADCRPVLTIDRPIKSQRKLARIVKGFGKRVRNVSVRSSTNQRSRGHGTEPQVSSVLHPPLRCTPYPRRGGRTWSFPNIRSHQLPRRGRGNTVSLRKASKDSQAISSCENPPRKYSVALEEFLLGLMGEDG